MDSKKYSRSLILECIRENLVFRIVVILLITSVIVVIYTGVELIMLSQPPTWKSSSNAPEGSTLFSKAFHSTTLVTTDTYAGTGWVLDSMVITAAHVIGNEGMKGDTVSIYFDDPIDPVPAIVVRTDRGIDVAVLRPDTIPIHITQRIRLSDLQERSSIPIRQDTFHGYGFPSSEFSRMQAVFAHTPFSFAHMYVLQREDTTKLGGASGTFFFSDTSWGIFTSTKKSDQHIMYLTPNSVILNMLQGTTPESRSHDILFDTLLDDIIWPDDDEDIDPQ